ncbi:MAG: ThiF family adenylyltransferase [Chloroflexi bacterium]|nr:ThiF family adenylyltransferase [Chloroflexota bacterium]
MSLTLMGCGGTGSHLASGLAALTLALEERGVSTDVLLIDGDAVEPKNVGRQLFRTADVGRNKAETLAARLNAAFGTRIGAAAQAIDRRDTFHQPNAFNVVVGAVDNPAARALIAAQVKKAAGQLWWLDCGSEGLRDAQRLSDRPQPALFRRRLRFGVGRGTGLDD